MPVSLTPSAQTVPDYPVTIPADWVHKKRPPELRENEIHFWAFRIASKSDFSDNEFTTLSSDELTRAARISSEKYRTRFFASRIRLRSLLHHYTDIPPQNIQFECGPHGKPALKQNLSEQIVYFNISDSKEWTIFAFAYDDLLGIDLETLPRSVNYKRLSRRVLTTGEHNFLFSLPAQERQNAFLGLWTRKEAYGKALGVGIRYRLNQTNLSIATDLPVAKLVLYSISLPFDGICTLATTLPKPSFLGFLSTNTNQAPGT